MAFTFTINGHTYTNDPANAGPAAGYRFEGYGYLAALANLIGDIVAVAAATVSSATAAGEAAGTATDKAGIAAAAATTATEQAGLATTNGAAQVALATAQANNAGVFAGVAADGADAAAESAALAAAIATGRLIYVGPWDASGGAYPAAAEKGWFYKITVAGVIDGTPFAINDDIIFNSVGWDKIDNQVGSPDLYAFIAAQG